MRQLWAGMAAPFIYFGTQIASLALNPDFDIARQQPSELGMASAHAPIVANAGFIATGVCMLLGSLGLFAGLRALGGNVVLAGLSALGLAALGVAMTMSGVFPLPNPLHYGFGLFPAGVIAPLFGAFAFKNGGGARLLVLLGFAICAALLACAIFGANVIVTEANQGLFARALSVVAFATLGYLCWAVWGRSSSLKQ